jgi:ParB/RepB/Spo0J family partition protein
VTTDTPARQTTMLPLELIDPAPDNPRSEIGVLDPGFVASIRNGGVQVAITVVPRGERYEIAFGHRRYYGSIEAEKIEIPAEIRYDWENDPKALRVARIVEQLHREDWSVIDKGNAFKQLVDDGFSQRKIAELTGFSQSYVSKHLSMLSLPPKAQLWVTTGVVSQEEALFIGNLGEPDQEALFELGDDREVLTPVLEHLEVEHQAAVAAERLENELAAKGVTVLDESDSAHFDEAKSLLSMPWVNLAQHRKQSCRAVVVRAAEFRTSTTPKIMEYCTDPGAHPKPKAEKPRTKDDAELNDLLDHLSAATARRHDFLLGIVPETLDVLTDLIVGEFGYDKDKRLLEVLGVEDVTSVLTDVESAIRVLWLAHMLERERPQLVWLQDYEKPRSVETFILSGVTAEAAQETLDELRELGYEPSWIEELRAGLPATRPPETHTDDGTAVVTVEVRKVGRKHVPVCSVCGDIDVTSMVTAEKAQMAADDHLWAEHGVAPVIPIGGPS